MLVLITIAVNIPLASAEAKNYTYWSYVPNPLLLRPVNWGEGSIPVYVNDSSWSRRQAFAHSLKGRGDLLYFIFLYKFIYFNWRLITLQYCIGFAICQHESATGAYVFPILNPPPSSLPVPSLWVVPVHQPQASSIMHWTWTGDSFHIWYYTCFDAILPNHPTLFLSHRVQKTVLFL